MKNVGCIAEFARKRTADLLSAYFSCVENSDHIRVPEIFQEVVDSPAPHFYISASRATIVIANIERGDRLEYMRPTKREMFFEIYRRYRALRSRYPLLPMSHLVRRVVSQPAPKFYLSASSARIIILKERKKWFLERSRKRRD